MCELNTSKSASVIMADLSVSRTDSSQETNKDSPAKSIDQDIRDQGIHPHDLREFVCGWGAASINVTLTFPLNKLIFRQQLHGVRTRVAWAQLQREGLMHLYRGLLPPFLQKTTSMALMFGMYDYYRRLLYYSSPNLPLSLNKTTAAILAGCTEAMLSPFERVQTLMQDKNHHNKWRNTIHAMQDIRSRHGVREFYRGFSAILLRNGPSNAMFFIGREKIKSQLPKAKTQSGEISADFVSGACLGAFISTLYYPVNVVKTKMQSDVGGRFLGFIETFWIVFNERNQSIKKMFRGAQWNFTRSLISWGVINASYELLKKIMYT